MNKVSLEEKRIQRERKTVKSMITVYCKANHRSKTIPCTKCSNLIEYTDMKLKKCPFKDKKPTCARCTVHCYKEPERSTIKKIMRFSGPRMLYHHPLLALYHIIDGIKHTSK